ncbi:hypothetical protein [Gordonia metallireducens]|nr:hypothetical protein [Gordonia metallireducens]
MKSSFHEFSVRAEEGLEGGRMQPIRRQARAGWPPRERMARIT